MAIQYKLFKTDPSGEVNSVLKIDESLTYWIPMDEMNGDYREYLSWVGQGNTPLPADLA